MKVESKHKIEETNHNGRRTDVYKSFFGGFLCCTWSVDGRFIIAGSQDDLLSIYGFKSRLLVRCQGHTSWPTAVSFDEWKCADRYFRFGSVGEDTKLCLWDFSLSSLRRPKSQVYMSSIAVFWHLYLIVYPQI